MEARLLFFALIALALTSARVIEDTKVDAHIAENEIDSYEADEYNQWIEKLLRSFSSASSIDENAADRLLLALTSSIVSKSASFDVEHAVDEAFIHQCGLRDYNNKAREISEIMTGKNHCLMDAQRKLTRHFRQQGDSDITVRDRVASQLLCSVVPEVLSCFEPVLKVLLSCTDDVEIGLPIYQEFKNSLMQQYCANGAAIAADLISQTPESCISQGMDYYLKFIGPAFIKKLPVVSAIEYPCAISQYFRQVSSVMLPMQCSASSLVKLISHYTHMFNTNIGCLDLYHQ